MYCKFKKKLTVVIEYCQLNKPNKTNISYMISNLVIIGTIIYFYKPKLLLKKCTLHYLRNIFNSKLIKSSIHIHY